MCVHQCATHFATRGMKAATALTSKCLPEKHTNLVQLPTNQGSTNVKPPSRIECKTDMERIEREREKKKRDLYLCLCLFIDLTFNIMLYLVRQDRVVCQDIEWKIC